MSTLDGVLVSIQNLHEQLLANYRLLIYRQEHLRGPKTRTNRAQARSKHVSPRVRFQHRRPFWQGEKSSDCKFNTTAELERYYTMSTAFGIMLPEVRATRRRRFIELVIVTHG